MPILGIIASQNYVRTPPSSYESIATVTVGSGGSATIDFTSIPATYTHLQIRGIARLSAAYTAEEYGIRFNSDTGSNYSYHYLNGNGSSAISSAGASVNNIKTASILSGSSVTANTFGGIVIDILDYRNTNKYKVARVLGGTDYNGGGNVGFSSGTWLNTNAITSVQVISGTGTNFAQYSQFALYGIKGA